MNTSHTYIISKRVFLVLTLCLFVYGCARKQNQTVPAPTAPALSENAVNINTAAVEEIAKVPYIGDKFAARIVEHREKYGPFRRAEHVMLVEGISDKKFRLIRSLVKTE